MRNTKSWTWLAPWIGCALLGCTGDGPLGPDEGPDGGSSRTEAFDWAGSVAPGLAIEIKGISGSIEASLATGDRVEVSATKKGRANAPSSVTIEVVEHAGGVTICAVYPDVPGSSPNECAPGQQGNMSNRDNDVEVTFSVRVPPAVEFIGRTIAGSVTAKGLQSAAGGYTIAGDVELATTGIAEGSTVSGSVSVTLGDPEPWRDLEFAAIDGNVTVRVPQATNARVRAASVNGSVASDFALSEAAPGTWRGTLGSGGAMVSLSAVNGDVQLLAGS